MKTALYSAAAFALLALGVCLLCVAHAVCGIERTVAAMPGIVDARLAAIQGDANAHLASLEGRADHHLHHIESVADRRLAEALRLGDTQLDAAQARLLANLEGFEGGLLAQSGAVTTQAVASLRSLDPTLDALNQLSGPVLRNTLGAVAAIKITAGETAQTMRGVRDATPQLVASAQRSADGAALTAHSTAALTANLARTFRPLPRWVQIPLALSGGVGSAVYPWAALAIQKTK